MDSLYFALVQLLQPYTLLCVLTAAGLVYAWVRCPAARRRLLWAVLPFAALVLLSLPAVSHFAMGSLEWQYPRLDGRPADAEAIVVLAGTIRPANVVWPRMDPAEDTMNRCLYAARLYHQGRPCPVVVSGGYADTDPETPTCAAVMRDFLEELGVPRDDVVEEGQSRTTYENAVRCAELLRERGTHRVVLVTDAAHLFRAVRCFRKQGLDVVPAPCNFRTGHFQWELGAFLPDPRAAGHVGEVGHEWLGTLWYWCRGRI
ncbi:MAG TPA: YdcF family protein [Gemmataceae bacterium]|nr:YdcF family protein [Gemmataceae bacterium]